MFRDQKESTAAVRGARISERKTGAKRPLSREAAQKSCSSSGGRRPGLCGAPRDTGL